MKKECENCGNCCLETDMALSEQDIELILNNDSIGNLRKKDFVVRSIKDYFQIKNIEDHCYFFNIKSKSCNIYNIRPQGCRFYPLIYDRDKGVCILDSDCPRNHLFYQNPKEYITACNKIKEFLEEQ